MLKSPLRFFLFYFFLNIATSFAQNRNGSVYFNESFGIDFMNQQLLGSTNSITSNVSSISYEKSGKLLFYADVNGVHLPDHSMLPNGILARGSFGCSPIIVPNPSMNYSYYVFYLCHDSLYFAIVDSQLAVVSKHNLVYSGIGSHLQAVSYVHNKGWWIIADSERGNDLYAFLVLESGIVKKPVISTLAFNVEDLFITYSSHNGKQLLASRGSHDFTTGIWQREVLLFDFDKRCGVFSFNRTIFRHSSEEPSNYPFATFSQDDSKVYITFFNNIIQYSGNNFSDSVPIFEGKSEEGNILYPGSDGVVYYVEIKKSDRVYNIYKVSNPNQKYPLCNVQYWKSVPLSINYAIYQHPVQVLDGSIQPNPIDFTFDNACTGYKVQFGLSNDAMYDSVEWRFGDSANPNAFSRSRRPVYTYMSGKDYSVLLLGYICGHADTVVKTIAVREKVVVQLGPDTTFCYGEKIKLNTETSGDGYLWSTGSTDSLLWVNKEGKYWLRIKNGDCAVTDTIQVKQRPQVWTALGDEYYICDDDNELVKLDAGEKFVQYKWTPTGDTSQWIVVGDLGAYFVVVKDYRGCNGKDGTKVERRCPVSVFYPNAFTPNGDGVNDVFLPVGSDVLSFSIEIYNAWGQRVFESNDLTKGWDGKVNGEASPSGTYIYKSGYSGYRNKKLVEFVTEGNITLLR